jgi:LmbE family N-acetylglucosaminyl deacetylase
MRSVLGIFPHPDDEAYAAGGTLALAARSGARVTVVSATRGERGNHFRRDLRETRTLALIRSAELACSCRAIGAEPPLFLDQPDGSLADANFSDVVAQIVRLLRSQQPQVVISLGADGAYGHPDHVALHRLVVAAVRAAAGGDRFAPQDFGPPHRVRRVLYCAFAPGLFRPQYDRMLGSDLASAMRLVDPKRLGVQRESVQFEVAIGAVAEAKKAAIACHQSQLSGGDVNDLFPPGMVRQLLDHEFFTCDEPGFPARPAGDIFAGM